MGRDTQDPGCDKVTGGIRQAMPFCSQTVAVTQSAQSPRQIRAMVLKRVQGLRILQEPGAPAGTAS